MNEKMILDITEEKTREFETYLYERENAGATISKYRTDLKCFYNFLERTKWWIRHGFFPIRNG